MNIRGISLTVGAVALLAAAAVPSLAAPAKDKAKDDEIAEFRKGWNDKDHTKKLEAIDKIPSAYELAVPVGLEVIKSEEWIFRAQFILNKLMQETDEATLKAYAAVLWEAPKGMDKILAAGIQENVLFGLLNNQTWGTVENWQKVLIQAGEPGKKAWPTKVRVRALREAARWRGNQELGKANVTTLIDMLRTLSEIKKPTPDDQLVIWHVSDALESLTGEEFGDEIKGWDTWWPVNKEKELQPRKATRLNKESIEGVDIEGETFARKKKRDVEDFEVLFLSEFGYTQQYWLPYAFELNKMFSCSFIDLPDASKVKGLKRPQDRNGNSVSGYYYPLPQLVDAFDARREQAGQAKVGLIAHGVNAWVALEFARRRPESLAFIVVIATWASSGDGKSYSKAISQMRSDKRLPVKYFGEGLLNSPQGSREGSGSMNDEQWLLHRIGAYKRMWGDPLAVDPMLYAVDPSYRPQERQGEPVFAPDDFDFKLDTKLGPLKVPTLIIWGEKDWMFVKDDQKVISGAFDSRKATVSLYKEAGRTPWAEDPLRFFTEMRKLLDDCGIKQGSNKKKK